MYYLTEFLIYFKDFVGNLSPCDHWFASDFLEDRLGEENQLLVFLLSVALLI